MKRHIGREGIFVRRGRMGLDKEKTQDCPQQCRGPRNFGRLSATFSSNWDNKKCTKFPKIFLGIVT